MECVTKRITWLLIKINVCLYLWALSKLRFVNYLKAMLQAGNQLSYIHPRQSELHPKQIFKGRAWPAQTKFIITTNTDYHNVRSEQLSLVYVFYVCVQKRKILYKHTGWKVKIKKAKITLSFYTWRANMHLCLHC